MSSVRKRVLVAMSGGVDSAVAAALLQEQGYDVFGVTLHLWDAQGTSKVGRCCAPEDREDARRVCDTLGIPHYVFDERSAFRSDVVEPLLDSYLSGETPSPCVHCNRSVKLEKLVDMADELGADYVATGHYVRLEHRESSGRRVSQMIRGTDRSKDQSYFLFGVSQRTLGRMLFPLGAMIKDESRDHARRLKLPNAEKRDSQELCFIPDGDVAGFIRKERGDHSLGPGTVRDSSGAAIGEHAGSAAFTVGQRKGLGIGGGPARYVLRVVPARNELYVGGERELYSENLVARNTHWMVEPPSRSFRAKVRIRYRHEPAFADVIPQPSGFSVRFDKAQRAITPGQAAVVYDCDGERVLGGGFIATESMDAKLDASGGIAS